MLNGEFIIERGIGSTLYHIHSQLYITVIHSTLFIINYNGYRSRITDPILTSRKPLRYFIDAFQA